MLHGAGVLAVIEAGEAVAFAQLEYRGSSAEIVQVYVRPDRRGRGLGTAVTRAAIEAAEEFEDLWIVADDEDRPKQLYMRLGFRPSWTAVQAAAPALVGQVVERVRMGPLRLAPLRSSPSICSTSSGSSSKSNRA